MAAKVLGAEIVHRCSAMSTRFSYQQVIPLKTANSIGFWDSRERGHLEAEQAFDHD